MGKAQDTMARIHPRTAIVTPSISSPAEGMFELCVRANPQKSCSMSVVNRWNECLPNADYRYKRQMSLEQREESLGYWPGKNSNYLLSHLVCLKTQPWHVNGHGLIIQPPLCR